MKIINKVKPIEVKRAFLLTEFMRKFGIAGKRDKKVPTKSEYLKAAVKAHKAVRKLSEKQLDKRIGTWKKRLRAYNAVDWYRGEISTKEVGVWRTAGGLPHPWTNHSLSYTANQVRKALKDNNVLLRKRARRVIPIIISLEKVIKKDKYSLPIVLERKFSPVDRRWLVKMPYDLDDGNMRSIAFAVNGDKNIRAYIGVGKHK